MLNVSTEKSSSLLRSFNCSLTTTLYVDATFLSINMDIALIHEIFSKLPTTYLITLVHLFMLFLPVFKINIEKV